MRESRCNSLCIFLFLTILIACPSIGYPHEGGGGGDGDVMHQAINSSVAPSGFVPYGIPGGYHFVEQQDYGQDGGSSQYASAQASADSLKDFVGTVAIYSGGVLVGYATAGSSLMMQMLASGSYTVVVTTAQNGDDKDTTKNAIQDTAIAAIPVPPPVQGAISLAISELREAMPETESSSTQSTGFGMTYSK